MSYKQRFFSIACYFNLIPTAVSDNGLHRVFDFINHVFMHIIRKQTTLQYLILEDF